MVSKLIKTFFLLFFAFCISADLVNAQWVNNPSANTKMVADQNDPVNIIAVDDNNGGVFVFWEDKKNNISDLFFIHANQNGEISFRADGKRVSTSPDYKEHPVVINETGGNVFVLWKSTLNDKSNSLLLQKVSGNGSRIFGDKGIEIYNSELEITDHSMDLDKNGNVFISYLFREPGFTGDYSVGHLFINKDGRVLRNSFEESLVFKSNNRKSKVSVVSDFESGAFFFWMENISGKSVLRAYFLDENGNSKWGREPVNISNINKSVLSYTVNHFGNSVYLAFQYQGQTKDIFHQLITRNGNLPWGTGGRKISQLTGNHLNPQSTIIDSTIYLSWTREFSSNKDIFLQKFDKNGKALWHKDGIAVSSSEGEQFGQKIVQDNKDNIIVAWIDKQIDSVYGNIFAQKYNSDGLPQWDSLSVTLGSFHNSQKSYLNLVPDGTGGAIAVFKEKRSGNNEIYAQKIFNTGTYASQVLGFSAELIDDKIKLSWYSANESPNVVYSIERAAQSDSGIINWNIIGSVDVNPNRDINYYELFDVPDYNGTLYYRILQKDNNAETVYDFVKINYLESASSIIVAQNSPNPFTDSTVISFYLPEEIDVTFEFFDSKVELIQELPKQIYSAGRHEIVFRNNNLQPGIYFYRFKAGNHIEVKKMVVSPL